jgi:ribonuclease HI
MRIKDIVTTWEEDPLPSQFTEQGIVCRTLQKELDRVTNEKAELEAAIKALKFQAY